MKQVEVLNKIKYLALLKIKNLYPRLLIKKILITRSSAIGDVLMTLPMIKSLKNKYPWAKIYVQTNYPEIFRNNPHIEEAAKKIEQRSLDIHFTARYEDEYPLKEHICDIFGRKAGVNADSNREINLYITEQEEADLVEKFRLNHEKYCVIQPWPGKWTRNKDWLLERWVEVVSYLIGQGYKVLQIGLADEKSIPLTIDLRGKTTIREIAVIVKHCKLLVSCNSFSQQLAHSFNKPAVILYGSTLPADSCHSEQSFIFKNVGCNPCWKKEDCQNLKCMGSISVEDVITKIKVLL